MEYRTGGRICRESPARSGAGVANVAEPYPVVSKQRPGGAAARGEEAERPAAPVTITVHRTEHARRGVGGVSTLICAEQGRHPLQDQSRHWSPTLHVGRARKPEARTQRLQHPTSSRPKQLCPTLFVDASGQAMRGTGLAPYPGEERERETSHRQETCFPQVTPRLPTLRSSPRLSAHKSPPHKNESAQVGARASACVATSGDEEHVRGLRKLFRGLRKLFLGLHGWFRDPANGAFGR